MKVLRLASDPSKVPLSGVRPDAQGGEKVELLSRSSYRVGYVGHHPHRMVCLLRDCMRVGWRRMPGRAMVCRSMAHPKRPQSWSLRSEIEVSRGETKVSSSGPPNAGFFGSDKRSSPLGSHCDNGLRHCRGLFFSNSHRNRGAG